MREIEPTLEFYEQELKEDPASPWNHALYAYYLYADQQDEKAMEHIDMALWYEPDYMKAKVLKGVIYLAMGDYENGWPLYEVRNEYNKKLGNTILGPQYTGGIRWTENRQMKKFYFGMIKVSVTVFNFFDIFLK